MSLYKGNNLISGAMPNSANQSLSNLNSAGQDKFDAKVNKAGDTMTGSLIIRKNSPDIHLQNSSFTKGTNPSGTIYWGYKAEDNNTNPAEWYTNRVGTLVTSVNSAGTVDVAMAAYKNDPNSSAAASIRTTITSAGVASCSFPATKCVDGQWIRPSSAFVISSSTSVNGSTDLTYSIASIIPNDGYNYEVLFCCEGTTGTTSGNEVTLRISSDIVGDGDFCRAQTRTNSAVKCGGTMMLPVSTSRKIYVSRATSWNGSITNLWIIGYRRLGTNT